MASGIYDAAVSFVATVTGSTNSSPPQVKLDPHQVVAWLNRYPQIRVSDPKARLAIDKKNHIVYIQPGTLAQGGIRYVYTQSRDDIKLLMVPLELFAKWYLGSQPSDAATAVNTKAIASPQDDTGVVPEDKKHIPISLIMEAAKQLLLGATEGLESVREFYKEQDKKLKQTPTSEMDPSRIQEESAFSKELNEMIEKVQSYCEESTVLVSKKEDKKDELDVEGYLDDAWNAAIKRVWPKEYIITLAYLFKFKEIEAIDAVLKTRTEAYSKEIAKIRI